jgi:hypothetical protein
MLLALGAVASAGAWLQAVIKAAAAMHRERKNFFIMLLI